MKVLLDFVDRNEDPVTTITFEHDAIENYIQLRDRTGSTIAVLDPLTDYVKVILPTITASEVPNPPDPEPPVELGIVSVTPDSFTATDNTDVAVTVVGTAIDDTCVLFVNGYTSANNVVVDDTSFTCTLNPLLISGATGDPGTFDAYIKKGSENSPTGVPITLV